MISKVTDRIIVKMAKKGNPSAMRVLFDSYAGYLTTVCSRYIDNPEDVKDVLQESLIKINAALPQFEFREGSTLKAWLSRICVNEALKFIRHGARTEILQTTATLPDMEDEEPEVENIPPEIILNMIQNLPVGYRTVFNLYVFEQKSHKEIAEILGIREDSSASQFYRARQMLAKMIKDYRTSTL